MASPDPGKNHIVLVKPYGAGVTAALPRLRERSDSQLHEVGDLREGVELSRQYGGLLMVSVTSVDQLTGITNSLKTLLAEIRRKRVRYIIITKVKLGGFGEKLMAQGASDLIEEPIPERSLMFKLDRHIKALPKPKATGDAAASAAAGGAGGNAATAARGGKPGDASAARRASSPAEARVIPVSPLTIRSDCWLAETRTPRRIGGRWLVRMVGPGLAAGRWTKTSDEPKLEQWWQWMPNDELNDPFIKDEGAWAFHGMAPKFEREEWVFVGARPELHFTKAKTHLATRFQCDDAGNLLLAGDSAVAKGYLPQIQATFQKVLKGRDKAAGVAAEAAERERLAKEGKTPEEIEAALRAKRTRDGAAAEAETWSEHRRPLAEFGKGKWFYTVAGPGRDRYYFFLTPEFEQLPPGPESIQGRPSYSYYLGPVRPTPRGADWVFAKQLPRTVAKFAELPTLVRDFLIEQHRKRGENGFWLEGEEAKAGGDLDLEGEDGQSPEMQDKRGPDEAAAAVRDRRGADAAAEAAGRGADGALAEDGEKKGAARGRDGISPDNPARKAKSSGGSPEESEAEEADRAAERPGRTKENGAAAATGKARGDDPARKARGEDARAGDEEDGASSSEEEDGEAGSEDGSGAGRRRKRGRAEADELSRSGAAGLPARKGARAGEDAEAAEGDAAEGDGADDARKPGAGREAAADGKSDRDRAGQRRRAAGEDRPGARADGAEEADEGEEPGASSSGAATRGSGPRRGEESDRAGARGRATTGKPLATGAPKRGDDGELAEFTYPRDAFGDAQGDWQYVTAIGGGTKVYVFAPTASADWDVPDARAHRGYWACQSSRRPELRADREWVFRGFAPVEFAGFDDLPPPVQEYWLDRTRVKAGDRLSLQSTIDRKRKAGEPLGREAAQEKDGDRKAFLKRAAADDQDRQDDAERAAEAATRKSKREARQRGGASGLGAPRPDDAGSSSSSGGGAAERKRREREARGEAGAGRRGDEDAAAKGELDLLEDEDEAAAAGAPGEAAREERDALARPGEARRRRAEETAATAGKPGEAGVEENFAGGKELGEAGKAEAAGTPDAAEAKRERVKARLAEERAAAAAAAAAKAADAAEEGAAAEGVDRGGGGKRKRGESDAAEAKRKARADDAAATAEKEEDADEPADSAKGAGDRAAAERAADVAAKKKARAERAAEAAAKARTPEERAAAEAAGADPDADAGPEDGPEAEDAATAESGDAKAARRKDASSTEAEKKRKEKEKDRERGAASGTTAARGKDASGTDPTAAERARAAEAGGSPPADGDVGGGAATDPGTAAAAPLPLASDPREPLLRPLALAFLLSELSRRRLSGPVSTGPESLQKLCSYLSASLGGLRVELWGIERGTWVPVTSNEGTAPALQSLLPEPKLAAPVILRPAGGTVITLCGALGARSRAGGAALVLATADSHRVPEPYLLAVVDLARGLIDTLGESLGIAA